MSELGAQKVGRVAAIGGIGLCLLVLASSQAEHSGLNSFPPSNTRTPDAALVVPTPEPQKMKPLSRDIARAANNSIPIISNGLERAHAFNLAAGSTVQSAYRAALDCLTAAVYYEAAGESLQGQRSVAQVVLNRVRHPAFPPTVCGVIYQGSERNTGCQFTFTCDGSLLRKPSRSGWERARRIAEAALSGAVEPSVGMATHYHTDWVFPYWADRLDKVAAVGSHLFYRWSGYWGRRSAFTQRYEGEAVAEQSGSPSPGLGGEMEGITGLAAVQPPPDPIEGLVHRSVAALRVDEIVRSPAADEADGKLLVDAKSSRLLVDEQGS